MTVDIMPILAVFYAIMAYAAYADGNIWGMAAMACVAMICGVLAWENRVTVKKW